MQQEAHKEFGAFVGIDWADRTHEVCLQAAGATKRESFSLTHTPEAIDAWVSTLHTRLHGQPIAIGLELNKGPLVSALRTYDFLVLFPINLLTLARYREAFTPSRAKDDPTDADLQLELLLTHRDTLQPLMPQSSSMRALAQLVEHRHRVVGDIVRRTNRLNSTLKNYFPHVLQWFQDKDTLIFCDFLSRWPTLKAVQLARRTTLATFFRDHHVRSAEVIAQRIEASKSAIPLTSDDGIIAPNALLVQALPGAGPVFASRLLVAFGEQRERYAAATELQKYAGIAPLNAVARSPGCTGVSSIQSSSGKHSSSGLQSRSGILSGPKSIISSNATRAQPIRPPCALWPSSGSVSSFGADRIVLRTMSPPIFRHSTTGALL